MLRVFARVAAAAAIAVGGLLTATGSATAVEPIAPVAAPTVAAPTVAADDPCGYWREGNWLTGYTYWYRHCGSTTVWVHITYYDGGFEDTCFGPWEKRQLSWRTTYAYSDGSLCR
jgi:hypothetical protein